MRDARRRRIELTRAAFDLLITLIELRDGVVEIPRLLAIWPDEPDGEAVLARHVWALRRALGDAGGAQRVIQRVHARGYRFMADVVTEVVAEVVTDVAAGVAVGQGARHDAGAGAADGELRGEPTSRPPHSMHSGIAPRPGSTLVGRRDELARLGDALQAARAGRGQVRWLRGGAGLGKTRTLAEAVALATRDGVAVCQGHCLDHELGPPLWPFQQVARQLITAAPASVVAERLGHGAADLVKLIPELAECVPGLRAAPDRRPSDDRLEVFEALAALLFGFAAARPLLVTLDDVHWADEATLSFLTFLCERLPTHPLLLLVGSRGMGGVDSPALERAMDAVLAHPFAEGIDLQPLAREEVGALLAQGGAERRESLVGQVHGVSRGNPFLVTQLSSLLDGGAGRADMFASEDAGAHELEAIVRRRLGQLPVECQGVLEVAAVLGRDFHLADLQRATVRSGERVIDLLYPALAGGIVRRRTSVSETFTFTHDAFRETLYHSLSSGRRTRLHRAVADGIARVVGDDPSSRLPALAHHYFEAAPLGAAQQAVHYGRLAAEQALAATAFQQAVVHYRHALEALSLMVQEGLTPLHCRLLLGLGDALRGVGEFEEVRAAYRQACERALDAGDGPLAARAAMAHAGRGPMRSMPLREAGTLVPAELELLRRALSILEPSELSTRALVQAWLAWSMYHGDEHARRNQLAFAAVELAREAGDRAVLAEVLLLRQSTVRGPAQLDSRIEALDEILQLSSELGLVGLQLDALAARGWAQLERGALARAEHDMESLQRLALSLGQPAELRPYHVWRRMLLDADGRFEEAAALHARELSGSQLRGRFDQMGAVRGFFVQYLRGESTEMVAALEEVASRYPLPVAWHCGLVSTYVEAGRFELARAELERLSPDRFGAVPDDHNWTSSHVQLAEAVIQLGAADHAHVLYEKLAPYGERIAVIGLGSFCGGCVHRALGGLALVLGRGADAEAHLTRAIEIDAVLGANLWLNASRLSLVGLLQQRAADGDAARAQALLSQVGAYLAARDVPLLVGRARALGG